MFRSRWRRQCWGCPTLLIREIETSPADVRFLNRARARARQELDLAGMAHSRQTRHVVGAMEYIPESHG